jgi:hypothetical protein
MLRKYATFTKQLQAFADMRAYVWVAQFRPDDIDRYSPAATSARSARPKCSTGSVRSGGSPPIVIGIPGRPASPDLKPPTGATRGGNKVPFTDEQRADIINACDGFNEYAAFALG